MTIETANNKKKKIRKNKGKIDVKIVKQLSVAKGNSFTWKNLIWLKCFFVAAHLFREFNEEIVQKHMSSTLATGQK